MHFEQSGDAQRFLADKPVANARVAVDERLIAESAEID